MQAIHGIVVPHHAHHLHIRQVACRSGEEGSGASRNVICLAEGRLDRVECHGSNNENGHELAVRYGYSSGGSTSTWTQPARFAAAYIRSGAVTPRIARPLRITIRAASASTSLAFMIPSGSPST